MTAPKGSEDIEAVVYRLIETRVACTASALVERVFAIGAHLPAHRRHLADVSAGKRVAGAVPARRCSEETAMRLVDQALQRLRKAGRIEIEGYGPRRGWRVR
jgi:DNA-binding transcriptional ArsR family regulator